MTAAIARFAILVVLATSPGFADEVSADALAEGGHWKRLRALAEQRLGVNQDDAHAVYLLAKAKETLDLHGALPLAERAVALSPRSALYHYQLGSICIALAQSAGTFKGLSMARRFKKEMEIAIELDPKFVDAREALMEFYAQAPGIAGGDKKKARAMAEEILRMDAARGYLAQATLARGEKNHLVSEELHRKALEAAPHNYRVLIAAASYYSSAPQNKYDLVEKYATEALKIEPGRVGPYQLLALAFASQGRLENLDDVLGRAAKNVPDDFGPYYQAAKSLLLNTKDNSRAEQYFRKYLSQEPEGDQPSHAGAHWRLGQLYEKEGKKGAAVGRDGNGGSARPES